MESLSDIKSQKQKDELISRVASIARDQTLQSQSTKNGLHILSITWEDAGRDKNSSLGPNISDMTLQLAQNNTLLPVIRKPNFSDETADLSFEQFNLVVGNEVGKEQRRIPLKDYLKDAKQYINSAGDVFPLYDDKIDKNVLTSAQFCILPLKDGTCEFNVNLFNYQSYESSPAVLVIISSQAGTSAQTLSGKEPLFFNQNGKACNFIAERLEDERKRLGKAQGEKMSEDEQERNCLMIFQVPLKQKEIPKPKYPAKCFEGKAMLRCKKACAKSLEKEEERGMDDAVLKIGEAHSSFKGVNNSKLERDFKFPIRCTLQFYKVTDSSAIPEKIFVDMKEKIDFVYKFGVAQGSLVVEGETNRTTEWIKK